MSNHIINVRLQSCSCGSDTVLCQACAKEVCGSLALWQAVPGTSREGNVCEACRKLSQPAPPQFPCRPARFAQGDFGEGYANYARVGNQWFSVNGNREVAYESRWLVTRPSVIKALQEFVGDAEED